MTKYFLRYKWHVALLIACIFIEPTINSIMNFWLEKIFNEAQIGVELYPIIRLVIIGFLLWITKRLINLISSNVKANYLANIRTDIKHDTFINLVNVNISEVSGIASSGEYTSIFINDINIIEQRYFEKIIDVFTSIIAIIIMAGSFVTLNFKIALPALLFGIVVMFVPSIFYKRVSESNLVYSEKVAKFTQKIVELVGAYPTIKNYCAEQIIIEKFSETNIRTEKAKFKSEQDIIVANCIASMLSWFMQIIAICIGLVLMIKGEVLVGTIIAARSFANELASPLQNVITDFNSIFSIKKIKAKIKAMTEVSNDASIETNVLESKNANLTYNDVSLMLSNKSILSHFSYTFEYGKKYLIIGENGSGKTSLFKLLKRKHSEYSGSISLDETNIESLSTSEVSRHVSYLHENVSIFSTTVKENITIYQDFTDEEVKLACQKAKVNLDLNYEVKDNGFNISSGEKRRIEIARSILRNPDILIFDEVVSTLDPITAYEIEDTILDYDKTIIFISHNFSRKLIEKYDQILVMKDGELVTSGTYKELLNTSEYFKNICSIKFGD